MTDISMVRGDSLPLQIVILNDPTSLTGAWVWDGTTTVTTDDTSGVASGDWVRLPVTDGTSESPLFKIVTINVNVSVVVENPHDFSIPSGAGAEVATPVDVTGGVLKFSIKEYSGQANADAVVFKTSYDSSEIDITSPAAGEATIEILTDDTDGCEVGAFPYDVEVTRQGTSVTVAGTATFALASSVMTFSDAADVALARVGDLLVPAGLAGNDVPVTVTETPSTTGSTLAATELLTDYAAFVAEPGVSFTLFRGNRKTPDGLRGTFTIEPDTTS
jgi:hypothetical protein